MKAMKTFAALLALAFSLAGCGAVDGDPVRPAPGSAGQGSIRIMSTAHRIMPFCREVAPTAQNGTAPTERQLAIVREELEGIGVM